MNLLLHVPSGHGLPIEGDNNTLTTINGSHGGYITFVITVRPSYFPLFRRQFCRPAFDNLKQEQH